MCFRKEAQHKHGLKHVSLEDFITGNKNSKNEVKKWVLKTTPLPENSSRHVVCISNMHSVFSVKNSIVQYNISEMLLNVKWMKNSATTTSSMFSIALFGQESSGIGFMEQNRHQSNCFFFLYLEKKTRKYLVHVIQTYTLIYIRIYFPMTFWLIS